MLGIYVHWPFCKKKCPYCDFNSHVRRTPIDYDAYADTFIEHLQHDASLLHYAHNRPPVSSIFFGGGTPSLMPPSVVEKVIDGIQNIFGFTNDIEITLEANPTSTESQKFQDFKTAGINRVSLGVQSLNDADLIALGRDHTSKEALQAVEIAQNTFSRWSFDMIYARQGQTTDQWLCELEAALSYIGGHISLYQLTIEDNTEFKRQYDKGLILLPDEDTSAEMYSKTSEYLLQKGYKDYEVSNYAVAGDESRHNLLYWRYQDYIGIGAGAHGRIPTTAGKTATERPKVPEKWVTSAKDAYSAFDTISPHSQALEALIMGLRLSEGVPESRIIDICGQPIAEICNRDRIDICKEQGLLIFENGILRTTHKGRLNLNAILAYIA